MEEHLRQMPRQDHLLQKPLSSLPWKALQLELVRVSSWSDTRTPALFRPEPKSPHPPIQTGVYQNLGHNHGHNLDQIPAAVRACTNRGKTLTQGKGR
ncbi:hypothetical protein R1flu_011727 [Riccia fluitans]|uniref:Uncharacterized protein n=1 Tax=Riccia fluitans TaxID=41844 RepID=A0ABD1Z8T3_9MARC